MTNEKEFITPGGNHWCGLPGEFVRRAYYPYGVWRCADGRQVLFNRFYEPIWERTGDGAPVYRADPIEWVRAGSDQNITQFYHYGSEAILRRCGATVLIDWGVQLPGEPWALLPRHVAGLSQSAFPRV